MFSLFKKEISQFFGSLTGYVVILVFLSVTGLYLWVFPGVYNIPDGGYAVLDGLFELAPWVYLFLVPAVSMRMFSEEKRSGTVELLFSRPLSEFQIVMAKYFAAITVILLSLLPTLIYFLSVYLLGNPVGSIDSGAVWGSYFGLFFLASIYLSIGLFASSLTDNQVVSFIVAVLLSFVWYLGFDFVSQLSVSGWISEMLSSLGINSHYESVSRGVLNISDFLYFVLMAGWFLLLTVTVLEWRRHSWRKILKTTGIYFAVVIIAVVVAHNTFFRIDFTSEKRFTLSEQSRELLTGVDQPIIVDVYLGGDLQPGLRRLKKSVAEKLADFKVYNKHIYVNFVDPYSAVKPSERDKYFNALISRGLKPVDVHVKTDKGVSTRRIFPSAVFRVGEYDVVLNLLRNNPSLSGHQNLNNSIELLEYEFARAIKVLTQQKRDKVAFLTGHGELGEWQVKDISIALSESFDVFRITADELYQKTDSFSTLVIAAPKQPFAEKDKFVIDQYIMNGGSVLWLLDNVNVSLDSLSGGMSTFAFPRDLNLGDQLFRYGLRVSYDLVQDVECLRVPVFTSLPGQKEKPTPMPWYFSPLLMPVQGHPIGKNINHVMGEFVNSVDFVGDSEDIKGEVVLATSRYTKISKTPMEINLAMAKEAPVRELFNKSHVPVGVFLEGRFTSVFKNRMLEGIGLDKNIDVIPKGVHAKMLVVADGNMIANKVKYSGSGPRIFPLGLDRYSNQTFGNKEFLVNAIHYLCDDSGLMELRSRTMKLRLLDKVKLREEKIEWKALNLLMPLMLIIIMGIIFSVIRKRIYTH
jgi:ABC-2 type transport system permease protein